MLFDALAVLKHRHPDRTWLLEIAGDGDPEYLQRLQLHCASLGLTPHVKWCGFVEGEAKQAMLQQADWFVLPSASENFGIAAAEADGRYPGGPVVRSCIISQRSSGSSRFCEPSVEALAGCLSSA